jgi:hypothetical protein
MLKALKRMEACFFGPDQLLIVCSGAEKKRRVSGGVYETFLEWQATDRCFNATRSEVIDDKEK